MPPELVLLNLKLSPNQSRSQRGTERPGLVTGKQRKKSNLRNPTFSVVCPAQKTKIFCQTTENRFLCELQRKQKKQRHFSRNTLIAAIRGFEAHFANLLKLKRVQDCKSSEFLKKKKT